MREDKRIIPLVVETLSASTGEWSETLDYDVICVPASASRPYSGWAAPTTDAGFTGYLMDGPTLGPGSYLGFTRIDGSVQDPVDPAFTLRVT